MKRRTLRVAKRHRVKAKVTLPAKVRMMVDYGRQLSGWQLEVVTKGERAHRRGDRKRAYECYHKVLTRKPKCWPAVFNLAVLAHQVCEHELAIALLDRMTRAEPKAVEAWYNLGTILQAIGACAEADRCLTTATTLKPDYPAAWINLGNAKLGQGDREGADACYAEALALEPTDANALYNRAHYLILMGRWEEGWRCYEARWGIPGFVESNQIALAAEHGAREWRGEPLRGRSLVVCGEQGWGDDLMCLRYAPRLRAMAGRVTWAVRAGLLRLVREAVAPDRVVDINADGVPDGTDYVVTTMSLHHRLAVTPETVPLAEGYL